MGDDQIVSGPDDGRQRLRRSSHIVALDIRSQRLAAFQKGVATQCCHNQHVSLPESPRGRP